MFRLKKAGTTRAVFYSLGIHAMAVALLTVSMEFDDYTPPGRVASNKIVRAVAVDKRKVEAEVKRLKARELERVKERETEERELADLKKERQRLENEKKKAEQRLADTAKKRKEEEKKKRKAEAERKAEERKVAVEKKRVAEERQKAEKEKMRLAKVKEQAEERARQQELLAELAAEEQAEAAALQVDHDRRQISEYTARIQNAIENVFNNPARGQGLSCKIRIRIIPGGDVVEALVISGSGNATFDQRAEAAVLKAAPLPVPHDPRIFAEFKTIDLTFKPRD